MTRRSRNPSTPPSLPNRNVLFEFKIVEAKEGGKTKAVDLQVIKTRT